LYGAFFVSPFLRRTTAVKVIKTVSWKESEQYLDYWEEVPEGDRTELSLQFEECVKQYCKQNDIRLSGSQYQQGDNIPIIEHEGKEYAFQASMRHWGSLMYDIWGDGDDSPETLRDDAMGYCVWAWTNPDEFPHEECRDCSHYYFNNMNFDKGLLHIHDHSEDLELNCRGIPVGPPKQRTLWNCERWSRHVKTNGA
jgi:hypothetical protein